MELQGDEAIVLWEMDCNMEESKAPISHIKVAQLKEANPPSCIIIREDSTIEIYKFVSRPGQSAGTSQPLLAFVAKDTEVITGCVVGHVTSAARREILFTCFSGAIKSLVDRRQARKLGATTEDTTAMTEAEVK